MNVSIMEHNWTIKIAKAMDENCLGTTFFPERSIYILERLTGEVLKQVIVHEVVHALLYESACYQLGDYNDEFVCDFIASNIDRINKISNRIEKVCIGAEKVRRRVEECEIKRFDLSGGNK